MQRRPWSAMTLDGTTMIALSGNPFGAMPLVAHGSVARRCRCAASTPASLLALRQISTVLVIPSNVIAL
jgi:hypothetical protein